MAQAVSLQTSSAPLLRPEKPAWWPAWLRLTRNIPAMLGLVVIVVFITIGLSAQWLAPYDPTRGNLDTVRQAPSVVHWLGTDDLGRDMLSRLIYGARSALFVMTVVTLLDLVLGLSLGAASGYFGGWVDTLIMRTVDVLFAFPGLLFIFFFAATIKPSLLDWMRGVGLSGFVKSGFADYLVVLVALGLVGWGGLARLVRGQILSLREKDFVLGAQAIGVNAWKIITRYLLPNAITPIIVSLSMGMGGIVLAEGTLSYLGIGLQPPNASFGNIIADNAPLHWRDWPNMLWLVLAPGALMALIVFAFNFFGDGLNDALNPELY